MDLSGLSEGLVVKNYKEMCKLLGEPIKTGKSRQLQLKEFKRYFSYEKDKQNFIITEIYKNPLQLNDSRVRGKRTIYVEHIELLLLNYLSKQKGYILQITLKDLFRALGMVNDNYNLLSDYELIKQLNKENRNNNNDFYVKDYKNRSYKKLKSTLNSSLNNLKNRKLIYYEMIIMIKTKIEIEKDHFIFIEREATNEEKNIIKDIEKEVLNEMNYTHINSVFDNFRKQEYYSRVDELLSNKYNIEKTWKEIKILFTQDYILEALQENERKMHERMLNDKIFDSLERQAIYTHNKYKKEHFGEINKMDKNSKYIDPAYLYARNKLNEWLIRLYPIITDDIDRDIDI